MTCLEAERVGAHVRLEARVAQQAGKSAAGVEVAAGGAERLRDAADEVLRRRCVGLVEPAARVGLLEDQDAAGRDEPAVDRELLGGAAEGGELEARVDDVEAGGRQRGVEEVVDREPAGVEDAGVLRGGRGRRAARASARSQARACNVERRCSMSRRWGGGRTGRGGASHQGGAPPELPIAGYPYPWRVESRPLSRARSRAPRRPSAGR